jgi:hypothetical protein
LVRFCRSADLYCITNLRIIGFIFLVCCLTTLSVSRQYSVDDRVIIDMVVCGMRIKIILLMHNNNYIKRIIESFIKSL